MSRHITVDTNAQQASILVAEQDRRMRSRISSELARVSGWTVASASDGIEAEAKTGECAPSVILLDMHLPPWSAPVTIGRLLARQPSAILIGLDGVPCAGELVAAVQAGAQGYIAKNGPPGALVDGIYSALRGEPPIPSAIALDALRTLALSPLIGTKGLTMRQLEILRHLASGQGNKEIAQCLGVAEDTVANHIKAIFRKLNVHHRGDAAWFFLRMHPALSEVPGTRE